MTTPLYSCVVRFWTPESGKIPEIAGTGFVAHGVNGAIYALTCAHVANLACGRKKEDPTPLREATIEVELPVRGQRQVRAVLETWVPQVAVGVRRDSSVADIAVFALPDLAASMAYPPLRIEPPRQVVRDGTRIPFHTFGFMGPEDGTRTDGHLKAVDAGGWFVAEAAQEFGRFIEEGLSGAPVFLDGAIIGMVVQRFERAMREGMVVPAMSLVRAWPILAQPYPGLSSFDLGTAHLYFGRGRPRGPDDQPTGIVKALTDRLEKQRLVSVVGASGSGKSSLARAGLAPVYAANGWAVLAFRPSTQPLLRFAEAIAIQCGGGRPGLERLELTEAWRNRLEENRLPDALDLFRAQGSPGTLLVLDQFEEFFTADPQREERIALERDLILRQVLEAVSRPDVRCVVTARLDLMDRMLTAHEQVRTMLSDPYPPFVLTAMRAGELREAVDGPATLFGVGVDPALSTELAADAASGEGRLPLLQVALQRLWSRIERVDGAWRMQREPAPLGAEPPPDLEKWLAERAEAALAELLRRTPKDADVTEADLRRVFTSLVRVSAGTAEPVRRIVLRSETASGDWAILKRLAIERMVSITATSDQKDATAELPHDALLTKWSRLASWIAEDRDFQLWRDRFDRELAYWAEHGREESHLLRPEDVAIAVDWLEAPRTERVRPSERQRQFIIASQEMRRRERDQEITQARELAHSQTRKLFWSLMATALLILLCIVAGIGAWWLSTALLEARVQRDIAVASQARETARKGDGMTAMLAAFAILPAPGSHVERRIGNLAAMALLDGYLHNREEKTLIGHGGRVLHAAFAPGGKRVVTTSLDATARVWDLAGDLARPLVLRGHGGPLTYAAFSPDGTRVVTASEDNTARVWDLTGDLAQPLVLQGHGDKVTHAAFSPDGTRVVTASEDKTARVWGLTGDLARPLVLQGHGGPVRLAEFSPDGTHVVTASTDQTARVWDLAGDLARPLVLGHGSGIPLPWLNVAHAAFSPDGKRVVTAFEGRTDTTAEVWDLTGDLARPLVLQGHGDTVDRAAFSPDGTHIVTASWDKTARVWDLAGDLARPLVLEGHGGPLEDAAFSPDGKLVVTASQDQTARVWDLTGDLARPLVLQGHGDMVVDAAFSPDGKQVVTASGDSTARVWTLANDLAVPLVLQGHSGQLRHAEFSQDGTHVVTASWDQTARVWDLAGDLARPLVLQGHSGRLSHAAFSQDGTRVVTASADETARVWDLAGDLARPLVLQGHSDRLSHAAFSPDGKRVVTASWDNTARVWDLAGDLARPLVLQGHGAGVRYAEFSRDGKRVVTASWDQTARVWDLAGDLARPIVLQGHGGPLSHAAFSPDGKRVVTASRDNTARVWDLAGDLARPLVLQGHSAWVRYAEFSPDGKRVVTASEDSTARVWDLAGDLAQPLVLQSHVGPLRHAAFSPDGKRVVTASWDNTARVWDLAGAASALLDGHSGAIAVAAFSPDGRWVVTASSDGTARIWRTPVTEELIASARRMLTRCLTPRQRYEFGLPLSQEAGGDRNRITKPPCA